MVCHCDKIPKMNNLRRKGLFWLRALNLVSHLVLLFLDPKCHSEECMVWQRSLLYGEQETKKAEREVARKEPEETRYTLLDRTSNLLLWTGPYLHDFYHLPWSFKLWAHEWINPLTPHQSFCEPVTSPNPSTEHCCIGNQVFNSRAFGGQLISRS